MADIAKSVVALTANGEKGNVVTWGPILSSSTFPDSDKFEGPCKSDRTIQFDGTWNGVTLSLLGSNDGTTWFTLTDPTGVAISVTANALKQVEEITRYVKPGISGGGGSTSVYMRLLAVK